MSLIPHSETFLTSLQPVQPHYQLHCPGDWLTDKSAQPDGYRSDTHNVVTGEVISLVSEVSQQVDII